MAANKIRMLESDFIKTNRKLINNNNKNIFKMLNNFKKYSWSALYLQQFKKISSLTEQGGSRS